MSLHHLTIRARLSVGFAIVLVLLLAVALTSLTQLAGFNRNVEALATVRLNQLINASHAHDTLGQITRSTGNVLVLDDEKLVKQELASVRKNQGVVKEALRKVEKAASPGREQELFAEIGKAMAAYAPHEEEFMKYAEHGDYSTAKDVLLKSAMPAQGKLIEALDAFDNFQISLSAEEAKRAADAYQLTRSIVIGLTAVALVMGILLSWQITASITRPIGAAVEVAERVAGGDLSANMEANGRDETAQLLRALSGMAQNLRQLIGEVAEGAHTVADTSAQIARGNLDLSQRTEEQASTLEETASSMEELTSTVSQNAENARQASQLAVSASEVARKGGEVVGQVVSTMNGISESSRKIADIIGVIDGIAFQTNILALNAAVEAARAGEQGRGFAVVAAEVRNLAQRSAAAAKEIKTLIGDSADKVDAGTKLVSAAGQTMDEIVGSVEKVSDLIAEIAAASREQSSGIEQVNTAVSQMEHVVQQNASLVEEATAATESMKGQADSLLQTVARFHLGDGQASANQPVLDTRVHERVPTAAIAPPIRFKPVAKRAAKLTAADHDTGLPAQPPRASGNGGWKEL
jgi:methyl-accepting chemotaxis protein